jgi:predicted phage-related endonuclease
VKYGVACEPLIRELFKLDHPDMRVEYEEWNIFLNTAYPWAHASLDGWMFDERGRFGVLEIKTTHIQGTNILKWKDRIPDNYYVQLLHYLMVTEAEFAILRALLKYEGNFKRSEIRDYKVERKDVVADIEYLQKEEEKFVEHIRNRTQPNLILPEI